VADLTVADEVAALRTALRLLAYLPSSSKVLAPFLPTSDPLDRPTPEVDTLLRKAFTSPTGFNTPFDVSILIQQICDHGDYFELQPTRARNTITALGRVGGHVTGFVANNSAVASGQIDVAAAYKNARFIRFCNLYNIPIVFMEDTTGFLPGKEQEALGIVQAGRAMLDAIVDVRTPRILLLVRNAFGGAYASFNNYPTGADLVLALPTTRVAVMGPAGKEFVYKDELRKARTKARELESEARAALEAKGVAHAEAASTARHEASAWLRDVEAELSLRYERELMNPREALALGSISRLVMPNEIRKAIAEGVDFYMRHYTPGPLVAVQREFH
jgi:acetyl-CoA carboxylase carboxyltransferase component